QQHAGERRGCRRAAIVLAWPRAVLPGNQHDAKPYSRLVCTDWHYHARGRHRGADPGGDYRRDRRVYRHLPPGQGCAGSGYI
ncbi:hypothetical protein LPJ70_001968, partial [Coemansia sp. RSA 2708]